MPSIFLSSAHALSATAGAAPSNRTAAAIKQIFFNESGIIAPSRNRLHLANVMSRLQNYPA
jgi:hypothetical protein